MKKVYIGIDPPKGWAEYDPEAQKLVAVETTDFFEIQSRLEIISALYRSGSVAVRIYIETPQHNRPVFMKDSRPSDRLKLLKIAQNIGENKANAKLLVSLAERLFGRENVFQVTPNKKSATKWKSERFEIVTGWKPRTSEHGRDAAMLVWGR